MCGSVVCVCWSVVCVWECSVCGGGGGATHSSGS